MIQVSAVLTVIAAVFAGHRWLSVSQCEHYIPGSCLAVARRWIGVRPPNALLVMLAIAGAIACGVLAEGESHLLAGTVAIGPAVLIAIFPWPMSIHRIKGRLTMTRRALTLAFGSALVATLTGVAAAQALRPASALTTMALLIPAEVDLAAWLLAPLERRAFQRYRVKAERSLSSVQPFVIAITGSWGKTSTKNHLRDLLIGWSDVVASPASWNNAAGLSRTINEHLTPSTQVLVAEMGMYGPGEIRELCSWLRPNLAVICAIGPMHMERVGSIEGIIAAKAEILEHADIAVLWIEDERLASLADDSSVPKVLRVAHRGTRGVDVEVELSADEVTLWAHDDQLGSYPTSTGAHPGNVGCAVAAALAYGVSTEHIRSRLPHLTNTAHRASVGLSDAGVVVIDDTYNSNPAGAASAVEALASRVSGTRAVVTPGIVEFGDEQDAANRRLAETVVRSGAVLVVVGWTNRRSLVVGSGSAAVLVEDREEARDWVRANLREGDGVLWENDLPDHYP